MSGLISSLWLLLVPLGFATSYSANNITPVYMSMGRILGKLILSSDISRVLDMRFVQRRDDSRFSDNQRRNGTWTLLAVLVRGKIASAGLVKSLRRPVEYPPLLSHFSDFLTDIYV